MTLVSTSIYHNYHLSYDYLVEQLCSFGFEDEDEIETIAARIINEVERQLPERLNWQPDFSEIWLWGECISELLEKEIEFSMDDFDNIFSEAFEKYVY